MMAKIRVGTSPPLRTDKNSVSFASSSAPPQTINVSGGATPYSVTGCDGVVSATVNGSAIALAPTAAGSCLLTIADVSSPSLTTTVSINVAAGAPTMSLSPNSISFANPTAPPLNVTIVGGKPPYALGGCDNIAGGSVAARTLSVTPKAAGVCSLVVTDANNAAASLAVSVNAAPTGSAQDNPTFHQNAGRTGWYAAETALTTANVASTSFARVGTLTVPSGAAGLSKVYAQPLYASNEPTSDGLMHNLVIVAGSSGQLYAYDDQTLAVVWHHDFTGPGVVPQPWTDSGCTDVSPYEAITSTPVIDRALDRMFVVVGTDDNGTPVMRIHAISLSSGAELGTPTVIAQTVAHGGTTASFSPLYNFARAALLEANGSVYVSFGSHCDYKAATTHGWLFAFDAKTLKMSAYLDDTNGPQTGVQLGSAWMSGYGPAADASGNVYVATGNGAYDGIASFSMSVLKLPGNLDLAAHDSFTPATQAKDSAYDLDLGSGGVMLLPDQNAPARHQLIAGGKCSYHDAGVHQNCWKFILNRDRLGGFATSNTGALWAGDTGGWMLGGPAYFQDAAGVAHIIYGGQPLYDYALREPAGGPPSLSASTYANVGCLVCSAGGGSQPIVSSNGVRSGTAIAWAVKANPTAGGTLGLFAFDALKMGKPLFYADTGGWYPASGNTRVGNAFISPLVANGKVYAPYEGGVAVFGLRSTALRQARRLEGKR